MHPYPDTAICAQDTPMQLRRGATGVGGEWSLRSRARRRLRPPGSRGRAAPGQGQTRSSAGPTGAAWKTCRECNLPAARRLSPW
jgi:hypothetical protein